MIIRRTYDPFQWNFRRTFGEMEDNLEQMRKGLFQTASAGVYPLINVTEDNENFYARAELPGIEINNLEIVTEGNSIALTGERNIQSKEENLKYHRREREYGKFSRKMTLSGDINHNEVSATLKDGILTIILPKSEKSKARQITVH